MKGFDQQYKVAYNDTDFCLRLHEAGYLNVWTPFAELFHHELKTRGPNDTKEKQKLCIHETNLFVERWKKIDRKW
jgi:GT2 family glycosyltransferase